MQFSQNLLICGDDGLAWHNCTGSTHQTFGENQHRRGHDCWKVLAELGEQERGQPSRRLNFRSPSNWHASMCFPNIVKIIISNVDHKHFYFDYEETYAISSCLRSALLSRPEPPCCSSSRVERGKLSQAGKGLGNVGTAKRFCSAFASKHQVLKDVCCFLCQTRVKKQSVRQDFPFC